MFNINQLKEITDNIEYQTEIESYIYNYPPNPNPTSNIVNITLVWDLTLNNGDISLYDYLGNRLGSSEEVKMEYLTTKRGILKYNCSKLDNGVYFFVVKHGDIIKSIPFIVRK